MSNSFTVHNKQLGKAFLNDFVKQSNHKAQDSKRHYRLKSQGISQK